MEDILDKFIERLIAGCNYILARLLFEYENRDLEDNSQENIKLLIANIMKLLSSLKEIEIYSDMSLEESLTMYEKIMNTLNFYSLRKEEILNNRYSRIKISNETRARLNGLYSLDIGVLDLEDFID